MVDMLTFLDFCQQLVVTLSEKATMNFKCLKIENDRTVEIQLRQIVGFSVLFIVPLCKVLNLCLEITFVIDDTRTMKKNVWQYIKPV